VGGEDTPCPIANHLLRSLVLRAFIAFGALPEPGAKHHLDKMLGQCNAATAERPLGRIEERSLLDGYWTCQLLEGEVIKIQKRALPPLSRAGWPPDSRSDAEDIGHPLAHLLCRDCNRFLSTKGSRIPHGLE
jgi:hypothetical protein